MRYIEVKEKQYPCKFGLSALKKLMAKHKLKKLVEAQEVMEKIEIDDIPLILEMGISNGCKIEGSEPLSIEVIKEAFDEDLSLMAETLNIFSADLAGEPDEGEKSDNEEVEAKKKPMYKEG